MSPENVFWEETWMKWSQRSVRQYSKAVGNDLMTSSSQRSCNLPRDGTNEWGHVTGARCQSLGCSGAGSIVLIRFWHLCKWINADNQHDLWCKPIPQFWRIIGSPWLTRCQTDIIALMSSQEIAELFRWPSYSLSWGTNMHYRSMSRCSDKTWCSD